MFIFINSKLGATHFYQRRKELQCVARESDPYILHAVLTYAEPAHVMHALIISAHAMHAHVVECMFYFRINSDIPTVSAGSNSVDEQHENLNC